MQKIFNLYFMWERFKIKNNQKEHLSLIHRGPNTVFNVTNFLQKRGVSINKWTPSIWKLSILVINVGNNLLNQAVWRNIFSLSMKKSCFLVINFIIKQQKKHVVCPWRFQVSIMIIVDNNLQNKLFLKHIFSLFINVSSILVICVIIKLQQCVVFRNILSLNMKVSSILVINVINNLQGKVISRNIFKHIICRPPWLRVKYSFCLNLFLKTFSHLVQVCKFWIQKHYHKSYIF